MQFQEKFIREASNLRKAKISNGYYPQQKIFQVYVKTSQPLRAGSVFPRKLEFFFCKKLEGIEFSGWLKTQF